MGFSREVQLAAPNVHRSHPLASGCEHASNPLKRVLRLSNTTWFGHNGASNRCYMGFSGPEGPEKMLSYTTPVQGDGRDGNGTGRDGKGRDGTGQNWPLGSEGSRKQEVYYSGFRLTCFLLPCFPASLPGTPRRVEPRGPFLRGAGWAACWVRAGSPAWWWWGTPGVCP